MRVPRRRCPSGRRPHTSPRPTEPLPLRTTRVAMARVRRAHRVRHRLVMAAAARASVDTDIAHREKNSPAADVAKELAMLPHLADRLLPLDSPQWEQICRVRTAP